MSTTKLILQDVNFLAEFFMVSKKQLRYLSFGKNSKSKKLYYFKKVLQENKKDRQLMIPNRKLKRIQKHILKHIMPRGIQKSLIINVTGFVSGKSIYNNATFHIGQRYLLKLDIKDFFPSISEIRVYGMFKKVFQYSSSVSKYLAGITTFNNQLPQGSPTSPSISNIIASTIDKRLVSYINKIDSSISYSRYADDITFGFSNLEKINLFSFTQSIIDIIEKEGFFVNMDKLKLITAAHALRVTGLTVNSNHVSVGRNYYKHIRAIIDSIIKNGRMNAKERYILLNNKNEKVDSLFNFQQKIRGHINFIHMINSNLGDKLRNQLLSQTKNN